MHENTAARIRLCATLGGLLLLAACATPAPPPPPQPPPPPPPPPAVVVYIPPRPIPPGGASLGMAIPPRGLDGIRQTVNYGLTSAQTTWNLRAALNVAALNCLDPEYAEIVPAYSSLLSRNKAKLAKTNGTITAEFRTRYGASFRNQFDNYMTQVYNYFALPPTKHAFCTVALKVARDSLQVSSSGLDDFARISLPEIEQVFDNFYSAYERYETDVAAWDAHYAPAPMPVTVSGFAADTTSGPLPVGQIGAGGGMAAPVSTGQPVIQSAPSGESSSGG